MFESELFSPSNFLITTALPSRPAAPPTSLQSTLVSGLKTRRCRLAQYKEEKIHYADTKVTYKRQLFLHAIASQSRIPLPPLKMFQTLNHVATDLLMEELEVVQWSIYIEKLLPEDMALGYETILLYIGFLAKEQFCDDLGPVEAFCVSQCSDFIVCFDEWKKRTNIDQSVSLRELNQSLATLSRPRSRPFRSSYRDYNKLVDQLFNSKPHRRPESEDAQIDSP